MENNKLNIFNEAKNKLIDKNLLDRINAIKYLYESMLKELENGISLFLILPSEIQSDKEQIKVEVNGNSIVIEFSTNQADPVIVKSPPHPKDEFRIMNKEQFKIQGGKQLFVTVIEAS